MSLGLFEARDGAVAEAAHHRHQGVEVLQLQQLLSMRKGEKLKIKKTGKGGGGWKCTSLPKRDQGEKKRDKRMIVTFQKHQ